MAASAIVIIGKSEQQVLINKDIVCINFKWQQLLMLRTLTGHTKQDYLHTLCFVCQMVHSYPCASIWEPPFLRTT